MNRTPRFGIVSAAAALLCCVALASAQLIPFEQFRSVSTMVNSSRCSSNFVTDERSTTDADPFAARLVTLDACEGGRGVSGAAQRSRFDSDEVSAVGAAYSEGRAPEHAIVHSFSNSTFDSSIRIEEPTEVILRGVLAAQSSERVLFAGASITFGLAHGNPDFEVEVVSDGSGRRNITTFEQRFTLQQALYRLHALADTIMDNEVPPDERGASLFRFTLEVVGR